MNDSKVVKATLALLACVTLAGAAWVPLSFGAPERPAEFRVVRSDARGTTVELTIDGLYVEPVQAGGQDWQTVGLGIAAGGHTAKPGQPQLPLVSRFLQVSDDRGVRVEVTVLEEVTLTGYKVYPAQPAQPESRPTLPFEYDPQAYAVNALYPAENWTATEPMIMRDVRLVQLVMQPVRHNPVTGELRVARRLQVTLTNEGASSTNVLRRRPGGHSRTFLPLYRTLIPNYDEPPQRPEDGSYLIITHDDFAAAVAPFAAWKEQKGWRTTVVTTSELGGNDSARIDNYITNAYNNWPFPPDYVLLVGDAPTKLACCHWPGRTDASDLQYSLKSGTDILADLMISRVCVQTQAEAVGTLNKLYKYEMSPWMGNTDWYGKVVSLAGYEGNPRFWSMVIRVRNYTMGRPFTQFDTLFQRWGLNTATNLAESLNQGRSWMLYRGHGDVDGWYNCSPAWTNSYVHNLNNGRMVPCVIAPTCLSGDFDNVAEDCHAETWLKAGEEKGGCAYFGSSEVSYSGHNDSLATGSIMAYADSLHYTFAQCTQWGKLFMLMAYPLPNSVTEEEMYMFNNFGEPELNVWSAVPRTLTVQHPPTVLIGSFPFGVTVSANDAPVAGALVCVMSRADSTIYHVAHTDASGQVQLTLNTTLPGDSIIVTVTGRNLHPYIGAAITIAPNSAYVTYLRCTVSDSAGGNNDGIINPGEAIKLPTWVKNWGSLPASSVSARLRSADPNITVTDSIKSFGTVAAGDSAFTGANGFGFTVAGACTNNYTIRLELVVRDANDSTWTSGITLWVGTAALGYASLDVDDCPPGGNGDGKVDPGETAQLYVTLRNTGLGHGYNVNATLRSGDARFTVPDSTGAYGRITRDTTGANADPFVVSADASIPRETAIPCTLVVTADNGYRATLRFSLVIGEVRAIDPIPDGARTPALYWAYEDVDEAYDEAPEFEWVDIAGIGTRLTLSDDQTVVVSI
ncbi:MAG: C25 family cysteine peptidase, partial [bacterium]